jgi:acetylornithine deacetylase/succinyl-diaminopimelate desuccinylase-like protein
MPNLRFFKTTRILTATLALSLTTVASAAEPPAADKELAREIYKELIEINTSDSVGDNTAAAEAMAARLLAAGFPAEDVQVLVKTERKGNLVARYPGTGERPPILLLAHLDVVEALPEDWSFDPFEFREIDGYYYGRGTADDKAMAAIWIANFIRMREEGYTPDRDLIVALTADEEGGDHNGVMWLLDSHRDLIESVYALNEGGGGSSRNGKYLGNAVQLSEKVYMTVQVEITNAGGHSSVPSKDNAIYRLAGALTRLAEHDFPVMLDDITSGFFTNMADIEGGRLGAAMKAIAADPSDAEAAETLSADDYFNALMRTTCVATGLAGGHAENALPQMARATVNCRVLPSHSPDEVKAELLEVMDDEEINMTMVWDPVASPPSPLAPEVMGAVERVTEAMWPGVPVIPTMLTGATDGLYLRNKGIPTYGVSGLFAEVSDNRAHGRDERLGVRQFHEGQEFLYRLVKELSTP